LSIFNFFIKSLNWFKSYKYAWYFKNIAHRWILREFIVLLLLYKRRN
jgi:hypothetical protein